MRLDGKTAIVTGGATGFGAGIARALAAAGAKVCVADANGDAAELIASEVGGFGTAVDVTDNASVGKLADLAADRLGDLDVLVNANAPSHVPRALEEVTEAEFDRILASHARAIYLTARHFVPPMKAANTGVILNLAATSGVSPRPRINWFGASKAWVIAATQGMAVELAPHGIRVNALVPVCDDSPPLPSFMGGAKGDHKTKALAAIPMGRFATAEDVGQAALFLCSDASALITGIALDVDGGRRI
jgi:3-oxoacyl-[acyl-carrier protein] reductase